MAGNEKQLEKVTLTLTNKMVESQACPPSSLHRVSVSQQHQSGVYLYNAVNTNTHTPMHIHIWLRPKSSYTLKISFLLGNRFQSHNLQGKLQNGRKEDKTFDPLHSTQLFHAFHVCLGGTCRSHQHTPPSLSLCQYLPICDCRAVYTFSASIR